MTANVGERDHWTHTRDRVVSGGQRQEYVTLGEQSILLMALLACGPITSCLVYFGLKFIHNVGLLYLYLYILWFLLTRSSLDVQSR